MLLSLTSDFAYTSDFEIDIPFVMQPSSSSLQEVAGNSLESVKL